MINIYNEVYNAAEKEGVGMENFQNIIMYLLSRGSIVRDDSKKEKVYYDNYARLKSLVDNYFGIAKIKVFHDEDYMSVRLYAPASDTPDDIGDEYEGEEGKSLSKRFRKDEVANLITLAILYQQKVKEGGLSDLNMNVEVSEEELVTALRTYIGDYNSKLSPGQTMDLYRRLKRLKVIDFGEDLFKDSDHPMKIRPFIQHIIKPEILKEYMPQEETDNEDR